MRSAYQTLFVTVAGLLCHLQRIYPIGAAGDAWLNCYQPNSVSFCFVLGVSVLLSSTELWPTSLRKPPQVILFIYLLLVTAFTVSITLRTVWLPLTVSVAKGNIWLAKKIRQIKAFKKIGLMDLSNFLESPKLHTAELGIMAIIFLHHAFRISGLYRELAKMAFLMTIDFPLRKTHAVKKQEQYFY
ncbi:hypothetical protein Phum_PHUM285770 [Pediculus humanus corporis]|uniref:Uncharacterized protein n=1 Tax=Pediculus humanus subsp. corporis TaxID=121224 RepID=E0VLC5_PEDHC|nr:uncharacterized protein Phum_PHUM285770 [Pediculus humanus corporis]EEB14181.1 hypothetical protein Phum_PHUM285770 [Pediculus humanus corporis]